MKLITNLFTLIIPLIAFTQSDNNALTLANGASITILNSNPTSNLYVDGLSFNSLGHSSSFTDNFSVKKSNTPISISGSSSIKRVYELNGENQLVNYSGDIKLKYQKEELNGIEEDKLVLAAFFDGSYHKLSTTIDKTNQILKHNIDYDVTKPITKITAIDEDTTLGITSYEIVNKDFIIYPNPAKDYFQIQASSDNQISSVVVFNLFGQIVVKSKTSYANIKELPNGVYLALINKSTVKKIIKTD